MNNLEANNSEGVAQYHNVAVPRATAKIITGDVTGHTTLFPDSSLELHGSFTGYLSISRGASMTIIGAIIIPHHAVIEGELRVGGIVNDIRPPGPLFCIGKIFAQEGTIFNIGGVHHELMKNGELRKLNAKVHKATLGTEWLKYDTVYDRFTQIIEKNDAS